MQNIRFWLRFWNYQQLHLFLSRKLFVWKYTGLGLAMIFTTYSSIYCSNFKLVTLHFSHARQVYICF